MTEKGEEDKRLTSTDYLNSEDEIQQVVDHSMTTNGACLASLSALIGGGICTISFTINDCGLIYVGSLILIMTFQTINRTWLYLYSKDLLPGQPESFFEIGYMLFGRKSIFIICGLMMPNSFAATTGLLQMSGQTAAQISSDIMLSSGWVNGDDPESSATYRLLTGQAFWVAFTVLCILPTALKKEVNEMHIVSVSLFIAVCIFVIMLFVQLLFVGGDTFAYGEAADGTYTIYEGVTFSEILWPQSGTKWQKYVGTISLINFAFAFSMNLFPVYSGLREKTNSNMIKVTWMSSGFATFLYLTVGIIGILEFGRTVGADSNIINNISLEYKVSNGIHWESFIMRILFLLIYILHTPPAYFPGKEAFLIIIDEIRRKSISSALDERIKTLKAQADADKEEEEGGADPTRGSSVTRVSLQSKLRYGLNKKALDRASRVSGVQGTDGRDSNIRQSALGPTEKVSFIRETQSLRVTHKTQRATAIRSKSTGAQYEDLDGEEDGSENRLAYKDMAAPYYYGATISSLAVIGTVASLLKSVYLMLDFVGIVGVIYISQLQPALFYYFSFKRYNADRAGILKRHGGDESKMHQYNFKLQLSCFIQFSVGCVLFVAGIIGWVIEVIEYTKEGSVE